MQRVLAQNPALKEIVKREVRTVWREILSDPDRDLELRLGAIQRLKRSLASKQKGHYRNLKEVIKKYDA